MYPWKWVSSHLSTTYKTQTLLLVYTTTTTITEKNIFHKLKLKLKKWNWNWNSLNGLVVMFAWILISFSHEFITENSKLNSNHTKPSRSWLENGGKEKKFFLRKTFYISTATTTTTAKKNLCNLITWKIHIFIGTKSFHRHRTTNWSNERTNEGTYVDFSSFFFDEY